MKFNIEIELDWIEEGGTVSEEVKDRIINSLVFQVNNKISSEIEEKVSVKINDKLDEMVMKTYEEFMSKTFTVYDRWGDVSKEGVNVKSLLKEKLDEFMTACVDENGRAAKYHGKLRYEHILNSQSKKQISAFIEGVSKKVVEGIKEDINKQAVDRVTKAILTDYDLKQLVK